MDARRAAEVRDAADRLRAALARVEADGEWAAGCPARVRPARRPGGA